MTPAHILSNIGNSIGNFLGKLNQPEVAGPIIIGGFFIGLALIVFKPSFLMHRSAPPPKKAR